MTWILLTLGVVALAGVGAYLLLFDRGSDLQRMQEEDGRDHGKMWARCAYSLVTGGQDYGRLPSTGAQHTLFDSWHIADRSELLETITELARVPSQNPAWDLIRAISIARLGASAGYVSEGESWVEVRRVTRELRRLYRSWEQLGDAYADGRVRWLRDLGDVDAGREALIPDNVRELRTRLWPYVSYEETVPG